MALVAIAPLSWLNAQQSPCTVPDSECYLVCPGNQKAIIDGVTDPGNAVAPCGYTFTIPDMTDFDSNGFGIAGTCGPITDYTVKLVDVTFVDTGISSSPFSDFNPNNPEAADGMNQVQFNSPGTYELLYNLCDISGPDPIIIGCCVQSVFVRIDHSISCNDQISVSLGTNCLAFITLDMLLEGNIEDTDMLCSMDFYIVDIPGSSTDAAFPDTYIIDGPGKFVATVTSPTGEFCETSILVEDKVNAIISCPEISGIKCTQSYDPGDPILEYDCRSILATDPTMIGPSADPSDPNVLTVNFDWSNLTNANKVEEITLDLNVLVDQVQDVQAWLTSPDDPATAVNEADTIMILDLVSGNTCTNPNFDLELDDDHFLSHNQLIALGCDLGNTKAYCGDYRPLTPFSTFDGKCAAGMWTLMIANFSSVAPLELNSNDLPQMCMTYTNGTIPFPYGELEDITALGGNCYDIHFENKNCGPYIACFEDSIEECNQDVSLMNNFTSVTRTWTVTSASNESSSSCTQTIILTRCDLDDLECPPDYDGTDHAPFLCSQFFETGSDGNPVLNQSLLTDEGHPSPEVTGFPASQFGDINLCFGYQATFNDTKLEICGDFSFKILREWTILDWCTGELLVKTQIIKVIDIEAPVVVAPIDGFQAYAESETCTATWQIEPPIAVFDCGFVLNPDSYNFNIGYLLADNNGNAPIDGEYITDSNVVDVDGDGFPDELRNLPSGRTWIRYMVEDDCGNIGFAFTEIDMVDHISPNAVGIEDLVVSLGPDGTAIVQAPSFDAGSYDNCAIDSVFVKFTDERDEDEGMEDGTDTGTDRDDVFDDRVNFTCDDLGLQIGVDFMVMDESGNTSVAEVNVTVQNPIALELLQQPADITLNCTDELPTGASFEDQFSIGTGGTEMGCPFTVVCEDPVETAAIDGCGNGRFVVNCTVAGTGVNPINDEVVINIVNQRPFDTDMVDWTPVETVADQVLVTCPAELNLDPGESDFGQPILPNSECTLLAFTYEDQVFNNVENVCLKILRTWTIIDWCTYEPNVAGSGGIATYVQVLKINDGEGPVLNCDGLGGTLTVGPSNTNDNCFFNTSGYDTEGLLQLSEEEGFDQCDILAGKDVMVEWDIDWYGDSNGGIDGFDAWGFGRDANGEMPYGCHILTWNLEDCCGNRSSCSYEVCIADNQPPNLHCIGATVSTVIDPATGTTEIWGNDFDFGSTDNVTGTCNDNELLFTLTYSGTSGTSLTFSCDDLPPGASSATLPLQMWVEDEFGNADYCEVVLILQDNQGYCNDGSVESNRVAGYVYTEENLMVEEAMVSIEGNASWYSQMMTESNGSYYFDFLPNFDDYIIKSQKQDEVLNGVSTLDLVLIQQHILGVNSLPSPYKIIAADADNNGSISAIDLITLRKVILGISNDLPNDDMPWRFISGEEEFQDGDHPFPYSEYININNLSQTMENNDFIAVKVGDVNATAIVNSANNGFVEKRSNTTLDFVIENTMLAKDESVTLPIYAKKFEDVIGYQFTLEFDPSKVELVGLSSSTIDFDESNVGYTYAQDGQITVSWNSDKGIRIPSSEPIFELELIALVDSNVSELLGVTSSITTAEAYNNDYEVMDINMVVEGANGITTETELYQNRPNPFSQETNIGFYLDRPDLVKLNFYNIEGQLIKKISKNYNEGQHEIEIKHDDLEGPGVYYYEIVTEHYNKTKKMIAL